MLVRKCLPNHGDYCDCDFLNNFDRIVEVLNSTTPCVSTRIKKLNACLVVLNAEGYGNPTTATSGYKGKLADDEHGTHQKLYNKYRNLRNELQSQLNSTKHQITDRDKKQWATWKQLEECLVRKKVAMEKRNLSTKAEFCNADWKVLQHFICASLYVLQPPRRNIYATMRVVNSIQEMKDKTVNYLVNLTPTHKLFYINDQKSKSKKFKEPQILYVNEKLSEALNIWLKYNKSGYLLIKINKCHNNVNKNNNRFMPMSKNYLTKYL